MKDLDSLRHDSVSSTVASTGTTASSGVGFITSTFRGDLKRFRLLRASLDRFAPTIDHWVGVHTEDIELFRRSVPTSSRLHLLPTAELLTPRLERARVRSNFFHRAKWLWSLSKRMLPLGAFDGYLSQQLVKLELVRRSPVEHLLVIDSDVVMLRPTRPAELLAELVDAQGRAICFATAQPDAAAASQPWFRNARTLLGLSPWVADEPLYNYITWPVPMARSLVSALAAHLERLHGMGYQDAMAQHRTFSEFQIYGHFGRAFVGDDRVAFREPPPWALHVLHSEQAKSLDDVLMRAASGPRVRFLLLQSILRKVDHAALLSRIEKHLGIEQA